MVNVYVVYVLPLLYLNIVDDNNLTLGDTLHYIT